MNRIRQASVWLAASLVTMAGCAPSPAKRVEVEGCVVGVDGRPVKGVKLEFVPLPFSEMKADTPCPIAMTDENGRFKMHDGKAYNVPPRTYKVTVKGVLPSQRHLTPKEYQDPPVEVVVPKEGLPNFTIRVG
jgi:hypothetical protein